MLRTIVVGLLAAQVIPAHAAAQSCQREGVTVQILGSGGRRVSAERASTRKISSRSPNSWTASGRKAGHD
jgi:hypothetical protein